MHQPVNEYEHQDNTFHKLLEEKFGRPDQQSSSYIIFRVRGQGSFARFISDFSNSLGEDWLHVRRDASVSDEAGPYHPFLDLISSDFTQTNPDQAEVLLEKLDIYEFIRPMFRNFLTGKASVRPEEPILEELEFEKDQIRRSIYLLLENLNPEKRKLLVIENINQASPAALDFIRYVTELPKNDRLFFIFTWSNRIPDYQESEQEFREEFQEYLNSRNLFIDFDSQDYGTIQSVVETRYGAGNPAQSIRNLKDSLNFLALREVKDGAYRLYSDHQMNRTVLDPEQEITLLQLLGDCHLYSGDLDNALVYFNTLLSILQNNGNAQQVSLAYRKLSLVSLRKGSPQNAEKYGQQALKLAEESGNEREIFYCLFARFLIEDKVRKIDPGRWKKSYYALIDLAKKLDLQNTLSYIYTNPYGAFSSFTEETERLHDMGIRIAKRYNNKLRLASAYQTRGLILAVKGEYQKMFPFYHRSERLKKELGNPLELSYVYNGLGFYHYLLGQYRLADEQFHKAYGSLWQVRDFHEIAMTLFNMSANYFFSFQYAFAIRFMEYVLSLIRIFGMNGLSYHSLFGICSFIAVMYCKQGQYSRAYEALTRIRTLNPFIGKNEEYFHFEMAKGMIALHEGDRVQMVKNFEEARDYLFRKNDIIHYMAPWFFLEYGLAELSFGMPEEAGKLFESGLHWAVQLGYDNYEELLKQARSGVKPDTLSLGFRSRTIDLETLLDVGKSERKLNMLHKKINEINFLNVLQNILSGVEERDTLLHRVMKLVSNTFVVDICALLFVENGVWKMAHSSVEAAFPIERLAERLCEDSEKKLILSAKTHPGTRDLSGNIESMISIPLWNDGKLIGCIFCATMKEDLPLSYDDLKILHIASLQIMTALEKLDRERLIQAKNRELNEANRKLERMARTDILTGVSNRLALKERLKQEIRKFGSPGDEPKKPLSLIFIDLDHFKHYNDSFGHQVGDFILSSYADMLQDISGGSHFIARFGGDEFVVVMPETSLPEAESFASKIALEILLRQAFQPEIEALIGRKVEIPENRRLTCSIGVAEYDPALDKDANALLARADCALYEAKNAGKNRFYSSKR